MLQKFNPKNENILIHVGGELFARDEAKVSVFDSVVQGGDAVWEGLRVYDGRIFCLDKHLQRMQDSAHALAFKNIPTVEEIKAAVFQTLEANNMTDGVHIRLTLTRGTKITSGMDPRLNQFGCTIIVLAEHKAPVYDKKGIRLVTSNIRRNSPQFLDSKIHHANLLNNILAKVEANFAGVDDALMLDEHGFVSEVNATNIFIVRDGMVHTSHPDNCLPGITRGIVLDLCKQLEITCVERNISLSECYNADEVFVTGTMGELALVQEIDGRAISNKSGAAILSQLNKAFFEMTKKEGTPLPFA